MPKCKCSWCESEASEELNLAPGIGFCSVGCLVNYEIQERALTVLNRALFRDSEAMNALFGIRVKCNASLANDEDIQVTGCADEDGEFEVTAMGIINGILGAVKGEGSGKIAKVLGEPSSNNYEQAPPSVRFCRDNLLRFQPNLKT